MENRVLWLRITYWVGIIFDGLMVFPMLFPKIAIMMVGISGDLSATYKYAMRCGAALMAGWTVLLFWADRKPVERRAILLITLFPVLTGLILAGVYAVSAGVISPDRMTPIFITQAVCLFLDVFSLTRARKI